MSDLDREPPPDGASGIAGQNMTTPKAKLFERHWIVHRTGDATYYDPSYGVTTTSASNYTTAAIDAWRRSSDGHWRKRSVVPAMDVTFTDMGW